MTTPSTNQPKPLLEVIDIHAAYGQIVVPRGTVVALLGPNGAGKTTLLKVISGQMQPTRGHVHLAGHHVNGLPAEDLAKGGLCTIPEGRGIFPNLTVDENLRLYTYAGVNEKQVREIAFARFPRLRERHRQLAGTMSGGEQQMLAMARALTTNPQLLILDELSMGLAPLIVAELYQAVAEIAQSGISVLVVEQFARTALAVSEYGAVMLGGRIVAMGQPEDLTAELSEAYLGGAA
jgi:branched-chain amino acid transport system ATP-binding protein